MSIMIVLRNTGNWRGCFGDRNWCYLYCWSGLGNNQNCCWFGDMANKKVGCNVGHINERYYDGRIYKYNSCWHGGCWAPVLVPSALSIVCT